MSRVYPKTLFGPMFYSWWNCPLTYFNVLLLGLIGFFTGPIFPLTVAWSEHYLEMSAISLTILYTGAGTGSMLYQWATGYLIQYSGHDSFVYVLLFYGVGVTIVYAILQTVAFRHGKQENGSKTLNLEDNITKHNDMGRASPIAMQSYSKNDERY